MDDGEIIGFIVLAILLPGAIVAIRRAGRRPAKRGGDGGDTGGWGDHGSGDGADCGGGDGGGCD